MARYEHQGGAKATTLASGIASGATTFSLADSTGWPTGATNPFWVVIDRGNSGEEKILCSSRTGTTVTVSSRGQDGTSAASHDAGVSVEHVLTATEVDKFDAHVEDTTRDDHTQYLNTSRHNTLDHTTALGTASVGDLADVDLTGIASGESLVWGGSSFAPGGARIASGSYTGDGTASRTISLAFDPKLVLVSRDDNTVFFISTLPSGTTGVNVGSQAEAEEAYTSTTQSDRPALTTAGFTVGGSGTRSCNTSAIVYRYVAFG